MPDKNSDANVTTFSGEIPEVAFGQYVGTENITFESNVDGKTVTYKRVK